MAMKFELFGENRKWAWPKISRVVVPWVCQLKFEISLKSGEIFPHTSFQDSIFVENRPFLRWMSPNSTTISETARYFWAEFSRDVRVGIVDRHYCFRIFNCVSINPGKIVKIIDCLKCAIFHTFFDSPPLGGSSRKFPPPVFSSNTHTPPYGI